MAAFSSFTGNLAVVGDEDDRARMGAVHQPAASVSSTRDKSVPP
jgi:hypothetical protein